MVLRPVSHLATATSAMAQFEHFLIAGLHVNVFTRSPLTASDRPVIVLFFLHGRHGSALGIRDQIEVILERSQGPQDAYELLVVAFVFPSFTLSEYS